MSALNTLIEAMCDVDPALERDARAELAALRDKETECDKWRAWKPNNDEYIERIEKRIAELEQAVKSAYATAAKIAENNAMTDAGNDRRYKVAMDISRQLAELSAHYTTEENNNV